jgi:hypothetical protein
MKFASSGCLHGDLYAGGTMDFLEDVSDFGNRGRGHRHHHSHNDRDYDGHDRDHHGIERIGPIINQITRNKPLLFGLVACLFLLIIIVVGLFIAFLPVIGQILEYINKNGIKGILDPLLPVLERLWKGQD